METNYSIIYLKSKCCSTGYGCCRPQGAPQPATKAPQSLLLTHTRRDTQTHTSLPGGMRERIRPDRCPAVPELCSPHFPPQFYCWAWHPMMWHVPWIFWDQLSWLSFLPTPCDPQPPCWWGSVIGRKGLDFVYVLLSNYRNISLLATLFPAATKKITSIPAKSSTDSQYKCKYVSLSRSIVKQYEL